MEAVCVVCIDVTREGKTHDSHEHIRSLLRPGAEALDLVSPARSYSLNAIANKTTKQTEIYRAIIHRPTGQFNDHCSRRQDASG